MTNAKYVKNLEFNRDNIIAGYIKYHTEVVGLMPDGFLRMDITDRYSKLRKPGVTLGQLVSISYERAMQYAGDNWQECITEIKPVGVDKTYKVLYQNKVFVICKEKYDGRFSIYHIKTAWRVWSFDNLEQAKLTSENLLKFYIWDFDSAKDFGMLDKDIIKQLSECITNSIIDAKLKEFENGSN